MKVRLLPCLATSLLTLSTALSRTPIAAQTSASTGTTQALGTPDDAGNYEVGGNVRAPKLLYMQQPDYTDEARHAHVSGDVIVTLVVDRSGTPEDVKVVHGLGHGLDQKAVHAVQRYKFQPATKDSVPVPVKLVVKVNFQIF